MKTSLSALEKQVKELQAQQQQSMQYSIEQQEQSLNIINQLLG